MAVPFGQDPNLFRTKSRGFCGRATNQKGGGWVKN